MEREQEQYGDRLGFDKATQQQRVAEEGLRRAQGDSPVVGDHAPAQNKVVRERSFLEATDAALNWAGGPPQQSGAPGDVPMSAEATTAAAVSSPIGGAPTARPSGTSFPSGGVSGVDAICSHHDNSGRP